MNWNSIPINSKRDYLYKRIKLVYRGEIYNEYELNRRLYIWGYYITKEGKNKQLEKRLLKSESHPLINILKEINFVIRDKTYLKSVLYLIGWYSDLERKIPSDILRLAEEKSNELYKEFLNDMLLE